MARAGVADEVRCRVVRAGEARRAGRHGLARRQLRAALAQARDALGPRHPVVAVVHNQLGILAKATGDFDVAGRHYAAALAIVRRCGSSDDLELADLYHNLGGLAHARGRHAVGEPLARRAVTLRSRRHGADAIATWLDRLAHAALLDGLGHAEESSAVYRAALPRLRRHFGPAHYEVAVTLNNLGCACAELGRTREAIGHLRHALALKQRLFGEEHPEVAVTLSNLATAVRDAGGDGEARALLARAVPVLERTLGRAHPSARACRANLRGT